MTTTTSRSGQRGIRGQTMCFMNDTISSVTKLLPRLIDDAAVVDVRITNGTSGVVRKEPVRPKLLRHILEAVIDNGVKAFQGVQLVDTRIEALHELNRRCATTRDADSDDSDGDVDTEEVDDIFLMQEVDMWR